MRRGRNLKKHWASPARRTEDSPRLLVDNPAGAVLTFRANLPGLDPVQEVGAESLEIPAQRSRQCSLLFESESQEPASVPARLHDGPGPPGWRALLAGARAGEDAGASGRETSGTTARASGRQNGRQDDCSGARRSGQRPGPEGARACRKARHPGANRRYELCGGPRRVRERARRTFSFPGATPFAHMFVSSQAAYDAVTSRPTWPELRRRRRSGSLRRRCWPRVRRRAASPSGLPREAPPATPAKV